MNTRTRCIKSFGLIALALFLPATSSWARLNETFDQIRARYGYVVRIDTEPRADLPLYIFEKNGVTIGVRFVNGRSAQEIFTGAGSAIDFVAANVLSANAQGSSWSPMRVGQSTAYARADGQANAQYTRAEESSKDGGVLLVQTSEFNQLFNAPALGL